MGLFSSTEFTTFEDLFTEQLRDLYDAEHRLVEALPQMARAASAIELKSALQHHASETENHVSRLEKVFHAFGEAPQRVKCDGINGILTESENVMSAKGSPAVKDAGLIAAAQRIEHYEIAGYGVARSLAQQLGRSDLAAILQHTLHEEGKADETLTAIAIGTVNPRAAQV